MKNKIKDLIAVIFLLAVLGFVYFYRTDITRFIIRKYFIEDNFGLREPNEYTKGIDYLGYKRTDDFIPKNKEDLISIFYTILDNGWDKLTFYCDDNYTTFLEDIDQMTKDGTLAAINNYVHPFNSYKNINVNINDFGVATIEVEKNYTIEEIAIINAKIDSIVNSIIEPNMSTSEKIRTFHDYIVNNTEYDKEEAKLIDQNTTQNELSYKAYNVLINGYGLCGGYSDSMAIYLHRLKVNNFKVSTDKHIWNAVYLSNTWYHIDATWDDPVTSNNKPMLTHDYFIINTNQLKQLDNEKHNFSFDLYPEFK